MKQLLIAFILLSSTLKSQEINGWVKDVKGQPLPGCNIYIKGSFSGTTSLNDGYFEFEYSVEDSTILKVDFLGFESTEIVLNKNSVSNDLQIVLIEEFNTLNAVTVTAGLYGSGEGEKAVVLNSLDIVTTAGSMGDITRAMQTLPGTTTNGESGRLFVHGGSADETGTYIDGVLVHQPYSSSTPNMAVRGRFNPFMFSGTSFSTGGYSAEYGQALSSILILNTKDIPEEESLNLSLMSIGADLAGTKKWNSGAITMSGKYMNLTPYMRLIPQNYNWNKEPVSAGTELSFRQKTALKGMLKVYASASLSNMSQFQNVPGNENLITAIDLQNRNSFINSGWKGMLGDKWVVKAGGSFTYNTDEYSLNNSGVAESLKGAHAKTTVIHELNKKTHIRFGSEYFLKSFSQDFLHSFLPDSNLMFTDHKIAAFAEGEVYASNKLVFVGGMRMERSSHLDRINISPRFSMAYQFEKKHQISFAFGQFFQDPINKFSTMSSELDYEKSTHYIVSYSKEVLNRMFRTEVYYKIYDQLISYTDPFPKEISNNGHGFSRGIDIYFRDNKTIKNGDYWFSYSFTDTKRDYLNFPKMATPSFANQHNLSLVYKHWISDLRSQVGATIMYGSPRPHNNPNSADFMDDHLKPYKSLDLNWSFLFRENIIFHAAVSNVLGFENSFGYQYSPMPNDAGSYSRTEILPAAKRFIFIGCFITLSQSGNKNQLEQLN